MGLLLQIVIYYLQFLVSEKSYNYDKCINFYENPKSNQDDVYYFTDKKKFCTFLTNSSFSDLNYYIIVLLWLFIIVCYIIYKICKYFDRKCKED